jgi:predicted outer membrane protein/CBS domain-containing protein
MKVAQLPRSQPAPNPDWLTDGESDPPLLMLRDSLFKAVDIFTRDTDIRLVPVVDASGRPVGAVFEKDVRQLLLNPFGHALLRNPSYGHAVARMVRDCPVADVSHDVGALTRAYRAANGSEGMILTRGGRVAGVLTNRRLLHMTAEQERGETRARVERAERIEQASMRFEAQVTSLSRTMRALAAELQHDASGTAGRASDLGDRAVAVASAASQTRDNIGEIAERGRAFGGTRGFPCRAAGRLSGYLPDSAGTAEPGLRSGSSRRTACMKTYLILGLAPALALAACGGNETTTTNTTTTDKVSGMDMPADANMADNTAMADATLSPGQKFANTVGASDYYEIEAGKLAQDKAHDQKFKDFGKMMVEHHTASTDKLKAAGAKASPAITPNPALSVEQEANLAALRNADDAAFDALYKTQQVAAHEKALAAVKDYAATGDVAELKTFAKDAEKVVQAHLTKITGL